MCLLDLKHCKVLMFYIYGMGFFMPAENAARQNNLDPKTWTETNISNMKSQLKKLGLSLDWDKFQHALQNITNISKSFLELYDKGLVYEKNNMLIGTN